jgi:MFS superfamily sulfate permease-like transporter
MSLDVLFQTGNIALLVLAIMAAEALFFARYFKRFPGMLLGLAAGACLVLALRAALLQQGWTSIALFLSLSFVFHVMEILQWLRLAKHQPQ